MTAVCTLLSGGEEGNELGPAHWKGTATEAHWKPGRKVNRITKGCYSDFQRERKILRVFSIQSTELLFLMVNSS